MSALSVYEVLRTQSVAEERMVKVEEPVEIWENGWRGLRRIDEGGCVLVIGKDRLPELVTGTQPSYIEADRYRPATLPNVWVLRPMDGQEPGWLLKAWNMISEIQTTIAALERGAHHAPA